MLLIDSYILEILSLVSFCAHRFSVSVSVYLQTAVELAAISCVLCVLGNCTQAAHMRVHCKAMAHSLGVLLGLIYVASNRVLCSSFCDDDGDWKLVWEDEFDGLEVIQIV